MRTTIFLNGRFLTQPITGVQRTAHELVKALDRLIESGVIDHHEFEFILIAPKGPLLPISLKCIRCRQAGFLSGNLWEQFELPLYTFGRMLISMGSISALFKRKQMVIVHDAATFSDPSYFKFIFRNWYRGAIRILSRRIVQMITVSEYSKKQLMRHTGIPAGRITVIPNSPGHIKNFEEADDAFKEKIEALRPFILGVSSLHRHKNFSLLSDAIVKANLQGYNMLIAGGASSKSFDRIELDKSVILLGYVTNEQLKYLYSRASLFVFPSLFEGFGIPPLEAMALGCPVLSSDKTALPEVLGDACEYFDPYSINDLVEKLEALLTDKNRRAALQQKGYQRAAMYDWEKSARALFALVKRFSPARISLSPAKDAPGMEMLYQIDGGKTYHTAKHTESARSAALISKFRSTKFQSYILPDDKVLEYGVGAGWNLRNIKCAEKLGYDISTFVKPLLEKYDIRFTGGKQSIPAKHFDIVICHHVLEHVPNPLETLKELKGYMKPSGQLLLFVPTDTSPRFNVFNAQNKDHHLFNWNVQSLCTLANESGYNVKEYKRSLYGFDRFISNRLTSLNLPGFFFYPLFYVLNFIRPDREIKLICTLKNTGTL